MNVPSCTGPVPGARTRLVRSVARLIVPARRAAATQAVLLICAASLHAQSHIVRTYTVADGLPSDRTSAVVTDHDGFVWICTANGLARFDGAEITSYGVEDGLPDSNVNHFLHARSGARWVATNGGGVARLLPDDPGPDGRVFEAFAVGSGPRNMRVNVLFETREGTLLAGTDGGLFRTREDVAEPRFVPVPLDLPGQPDAGLQIWSLAEGADGRIWVGSSAGVVALGAWERLGHMRVAPAQGADHVRAMAIDSAGRLWLGHEAGLLVWVPPTLDEATVVQDALIQGAAPCVRPSGAAEDAHLPVAPGAVCHMRPGGASDHPAWIRGILRTPDDWLWMTSSIGLMAFDGTRFRSFEDATGGSRSLAVDPGGDLWIGSYRGALRVQRGGFTSYALGAPQDPVPEGRPTRILGGPDGRIYAVSMSSTIHRFDGDRWTAVRPPLPRQVGAVGPSTYGAALLDRSGAWWIGTGIGLMRFPVVARLEELADVAPIAHYTTAEGLAGNDVWHLYEDAHGDLWIATRIPGTESLTRWDRATGRFQRYGTDEGLPAGRAAWGFAEDEDGTLWISFWDGGLARFDGRSFRYFATEADVPPGPRYQILFDRQGWLWVGGRQILYSRDPGADDPIFETFRTAEGRSIAAYALVEDAGGRIYAGTPTGIVRFRPGEDGVQQLGTGGVFTDLLGAVFQDTDSTLWAIRSDAVLRYEPRYDRHDRRPAVWIGGVRVGGEPRPVPAMGTARLAPVTAAGGRQVQIDYFGLAFGADQPLRFQVRLEGAEETWSAPTTERSVRYAGLGPGKYEFQVRPVDSSGGTVAALATVPFIVPPPVWRRAWFLALFAAMLGSLLLGLHRMRVHRLLELERVRTRIAADLHDDLGASLARVSLLTEAIRRTMRDRPAVAERMLGEIGDTSRGLVSAAGDIAFSIDPGGGSLDALVARVHRFAEELLVGLDAQWAFRLQGNMADITLSSDQRRHLLAILKEALSNAARHGRPEHLTMTLLVRSDALEVEIVDDGRGFAPTEAEGPGPETGHGLRNMRRRAGELGGSLDVDSRPGGGTRVTLVVPRRHASRMTMR